MSNCTIRTCGRPLLDSEAGRTACGRCEQRIRGWLRELPHQVRLLQACLQPDRTPLTGSVHGGRAHAPLPVRGDVLTLLGAGAPGSVENPHGDQTGPLPIDRQMLNWAEMTAERVGLSRTPWRRPGRTWASWLTAYLPWALTAPWIGDMHDELADLLYTVRGITHTEPRRRPKDAPCPSCTAFALIEEDWQPYIECTLCGRLLTPAEYDDHARRTMPALYRTALLIAAHAAEPGHA